MILWEAQSTKVVVFVIVRIASTYPPTPPCPSLLAKISHHPRTPAFSSSLAYTYPSNPPPREGGKYKPREEEGDREGWVGG